MFKLRSFSPFFFLFFFYFFHPKETRQQELKLVITITMGMEHMLIMKQRRSTTDGLLKNSAQAMINLGYMHDRGLGMRQVTASSYMALANLFGPRS